MNNVPLIACLLVLAFFVSCLVVASEFRAVRRLFLMRCALLMAVISLVAIVYILRDSYGLQIESSIAALADAMGIVTLILTAGFAVGGTVLDHVFQKIRVGIVIPSRVPFHKELRRGLHEGLGGLSIEVWDEFADTNASLEDLSQFDSCFHKAITFKPDYLIIAAPGSSYLDNPNFNQQLSRFLSRGGRVFFIENAPSFMHDEGSADKRNVSVVRSDSQTGAMLLGNFIKQNWDGKSKIGLVAGPAESEPSRSRLEILTTIVKIPNHLIVHSDLSGWSMEAAYDYTKQMMEGPVPPRMIVCFNDTMALGAIRALRENGKDLDISVIGYDGIPRALTAIDEPRNCFAATIRIPPSQYGVVIANQIIEDINGGWIRSAGISSHTIPISSSNLITKHNVGGILND